MPISPLPFLLPIVFVVILCLGAKRGRRAFFGSCIVVVAAALAVVLPLHTYGWWLTIRSRTGDSATLYQLAKWHETHAERIGAWILWPEAPDVVGGFECLERAAEHDYPPALYAAGVRIKYGVFVPEPTDWSGPSGNVFPQPARGQALIDRALALGYRPVIEEQHFYWQVYRKVGASDPAG